MMVERSKMFNFSGTLLSMYTYVSCYGLMVTHIISFTWFLSVPKHTLFSECHYYLYNTVFWTQLQYMYMLVYFIMTTVFQLFYLIHCVFRVWQSSFFSRESCHVCGVHKKQLSKVSSGRERIKGIYIYIYMNYWYIII